MNGGSKAAWLIFVIFVLFVLFVPIATALACLIARGRRMAQRSEHWAQASRKHAESYIREVAGATPSDETAKAKALHENGAMTHAEYDALKAWVISGEPHPISNELGRLAAGPRGAQPALP